MEIKNKGLVEFKIGKIIWNRYLSAVCFLTVLYVFSCQSSKEEHAAEEEAHEEHGLVLTTAQFKQAGIVLGKIENKNLSSTIAVSGVLDVPPQNLVFVSALMGGFIKSTQLLQGMKVKKGQVLAVIQNPDFVKLQREYLENKQKLEFLSFEYKRQEELANENISAKKELQQVTSDFNSIKASVSALEEQLRMLQIDPSSLVQRGIHSSVNILSPIEGYVTAVNVNLGKFVNPQDVICEIVDTDHLHAELTVFERDITKVKKGQKVRFSLVNEGDKERGASIYLINHKIEVDRTVRVHAHLDIDDPHLLPNMYLKAVIEIGDHLTPSLPEQAIVSAAGKDYIFVVAHDDHKAKEAKEQTGRVEFEAIEVKKGISQKGYTEVILPANFETKAVEVVLEGAYSLLSKMVNTGEEGHGH